MKITSKADTFSPAFELKDGGLVVKPDVAIEGLSAAAPFVTLPPSLAPGVDYSIHDGGDGGLTANTAPIPGAVGGFHVGLDGQIVPASIHDSLFRPSCLDPRGMVYVAPGFWVDIYLAGEDGTSKAGAKIARNITYWKALELLAAQGKTLLSIPEFYLAALGVVEGKNCEDRPELTAHVEDLRSTAGLEQATGCIWIWGREVNPATDRAALMGGSWTSFDAGPRQLDNVLADYSFGDIGARGRCDHLTLA